MDDAILAATVALLAEVGLEGATTDAIAQRAGVARATVYLRWPTHDALINAAVRHAIGREPFRLSGDIATDLRLGVEQAQAILSEPLFAVVMPVIVRALLRPPQAGMTFDTLFPNRSRFAAEYRQLAAEQGFRDDVEGEVVADLVMGGLLARMLATGAGPASETRDQVLDILLSALRRP